GQIVENHIL
ncbi:hypothetical protein EC960109_1751B, partial [Escherichia coli 96.0109]